MSTVPADLKSVDSAQWAERQQVHSGPRPSPLSHIPALDGLRAVAILLVIVHNAGSVDGQLSGIPLRLWAVLSNAGWAGVQLFFALSGFLITRILLESKGADGWLRNFYVRRVLRIVPLYYTLLAVVFFVAPHVALLTPLAGHPTRSSLWLWAYLSNWVSPFGGLPASLPHVWSLAVEEQFYLIWPFVVALFAEGTVALISIGLIVCALVARIGLHAALPINVAHEAAYTFTIARCDAIALGALVALAFRNKRAFAFIRPRAFAAMLVAFVAVFCVMAIVHGLPAEGTAAEVVEQPLVGVLSALMVFVCAAAVIGPRDVGIRRTFVECLSNRWMLSIGKYSYAIYIFQTPVNEILHASVRRFLIDGSDTRRFAAHVLYSVVVFGISTVLALVSWKLIEQPFLSLKRFFPMSRPRASVPADYVAEESGHPGVMHT